MNLGTTTYRLLFADIYGPVRSRSMELHAGVVSLILQGLKEKPEGYAIDLGFGMERVIHLEVESPR